VCLHLIQGRVWTHQQTEDTRFPHAPRNQLRILTAKVEDQDGLGVGSIEVCCLHRFRQDRKDGIVAAAPLSFSAWLSGVSGVTLSNGQFLAA
jgi:hypothetical protein